MKRCRDAGSAPLPPSALEAHLRALPSYRGQLVHALLSDPRAARHAPHPPPLPTPVLAALPRRLFTHQAAAIDASLAGRDVVLATPTSSGKTAVGFALAAAAICGDGGATALFLYPTKALQQDQLRALSSFLAPSECFDGRVRAGVLSGDTPEDARLLLRDEGNVLLANADILSCSLLPDLKWRRFFSRLALIVVDEAHVYGGAHGAHAACVLRRLLRLMRACNAPRPRFLLCSATVGNPLVLLRAMAPICDAAAVAEPLIVSEDGSAAGARAIFVWQPPLEGSEGEAVGSAVVNDGGKHQSAWLLDTSTLRDEIVTALSVSHCVRGCDAGAGAAAPHCVSADETPHSTIPLLSDFALSTRPLATDAELLEDWVDAAAGEVESWWALDRDASFPPRQEAPSDAVNSSTSLGPLLMEACVFGRTSEGAPMRRVAALAEAAHLTVALIRAGQRSLVFCRSRADTDALHQRIVVLLAASMGGEEGEEAAMATAAAAVRSYRGGDQAEHRRSVESALARGSLSAVVCTSALELGVDIGHLDCIVIVGCPSSAASLRQQMGRGGRGVRPCSTFIVTGTSATDALLLRAPGAFLTRPPEAFALNPFDLPVTERHALAAAASSSTPLVLEDARFFGAALAPAVFALRASGQLYEVPRGAKAPPPLSSRAAKALAVEALKQCGRDWSGGGSDLDAAAAAAVSAFTAHDGGAQCAFVASSGSHPASFSLRGAEDLPFTVVTDSGGGASRHAVIEEGLAPSRVFLHCRPGMVFASQGVAYTVRTATSIAHTADRGAEQQQRLVVVDRVHPHAPPRFTRPLVSLTCTVLEVAATGCSPHATDSGPAHVASLGRVRVTTRVPSFSRIDARSFRVVEIVPLSGSSTHALTHEAAAVWFAPHGGLSSLLDRLDCCGDGGLPLALRAAAHTLSTALPLIVQCEPSDVESQRGRIGGAAGQPALFVWEVPQRGEGVAAAAFARSREWLTIALDTLAACPCATGCAVCCGCGAVGSAPRAPRSLKLGAIVVLVSCMM